jgi:hypothetical protein
MLAGGGTVLYYTISWSYHVVPMICDPSVSLIDNSNTQGLSCIAAMYIGAMGAVISMVLPVLVAQYTVGNGHSQA